MLIYSLVKIVEFVDGIRTIFCLIVVCGMSQKNGKYLPDLTRGAEKGRVKHFSDMCHDIVVVVVCSMQRSG